MKGGGGIALLVDPIPLHRPNLGAIFHSDPPSFPNTNHHDDDVSQSQLSGSNASPYLMSPADNEAPSSPFAKSPWLPINFHREDSCNGLVGSLVRKEGHVYSLAVSGDLLYTGSESKNIRVWKSLKDFTGFKSSSGFVKAIVISGERIFTGHHDGKIRVWNKKNDTHTTSIHRRIGSLPTLTDYVKSSMNRRNIKHHDAVSCLSLDEENGLLYSGSWDKTVKIWSVSDYRLLESVDDAHRDAVNAVATGFGCYVFTGSADGTVKMWRREWKLGKGTTKKKRKTRHVLERVLLEQESAVTALAVNRWSAVVYGGSSDGAVNFWEQKKKNGVCYGGVLRGHKLAVLCVAVAGNLVLSGSADKNVCVWRREENGVHTWLSVLTGHAGPVKCIAAVEEEDEQHEMMQKCGKGYQRCMVYTGSLDKSVKVWRVSENAP